MAWETPHKARWAELGVHVGYSAPTGAKTPAQWLASGSGLFAWLDLSGLSAAQTLQAVAAALSLSPGTPTLSQVNAQTLQAVAAALLLQAGTPTLSQVQAQTLTAAAAQLLLVAGTPTISQARALSAVAGALALTPGTPTLSQTAGGGSAAVSDDFTRANSATLGANWTAPTGMTGLAIMSNAASAPAGTTRVSFYSGATFAANHYAEASIAGAYGGDGLGSAIAVRMSPSADSCYLLRYETYDDGEGGGWDHVRLMKRIAGVETQLGTTYADASIQGSLGGVYRLEVVGSTLTAKKVTGVHGGALTTIITATDATLTGGSPGLHTVSGSGSAVSSDSFYGGDI